MRPPRGSARCRAAGLSACARRRPECLRQPERSKPYSGGEWLQRDGASCFVVETRRVPASVHGDDAVGAIADPAGRRGRRRVPGRTRARASCHSSSSISKRPASSGGAGTYAFLVGCGWFDDEGGFATRQYLLVRIADERALLALVAGELARAGALVSFNGKSFDAPMLETRYLYHRLEWAAARLPHLDMLHVARRFWRGGTAVAPDAAPAESSCSLVALERQLSARGGEGDVSGFEIPARYFHFVRTGDARPLQIVFEHNRLDLLSLAALTARALHLVRVGPEQAADPREALALGWIYARAGLDARGRQAYERAIDLSSGDGTWPASPSSAAIRVEALRSLALLLRRSRSYDQAAGCWRQILDVRAVRVTSLVKPATRSRSITSIACAISRRRRISPCAASNTARTRAGTTRSGIGWRGLTGRLESLKLRTFSGATIQRLQLRTEPRTGASKASRPATDWLTGRRRALPSWLLPPLSGSPTSARRTSC